MTLFDLQPSCHILLFASTTFGCHIALWAFATFGHSSVEGHIQSFWNWKELKKTMRQIKIWNEKAWCHERRGVTQEKITRRQTKLWLRRNYLEKVNKEIIEHIDIRREKDL